jgi:hypothetical protein
MKDPVHRRGLLCLLVDVSFVMNGTENWLHSIQRRDSDSQLPREYLSTGISVAVFVSGQFRAGRPSFEHKYASSRWISSCSRNCGDCDFRLISPQRFHARRSVGTKLVALSRLAGGVAGCCLSHERSCKRDRDSKENDATSSEQYMRPPSFISPAALRLFEEDPAKTKHPRNYLGRSFW